MSFSPKRSCWSIPEKWLKIPGNFHWIFDQLLQFTGSLVCQTRAVLSSFHMAMRFSKERPVISKRFSALGFLQCHYQTLMLRISFGFTWLLTLVARLHPILTATTLHWPHLCVLEYRSMCACGKLTWTLIRSPNPGVTEHVRVRRVDMNDNTLHQKKTWRDVACACAASWHER